MTPSSVLHDAFNKQEGLARHEQPVFFEMSGMTMALEMPVSSSRLMNDDALGRAGALPADDVSGDAQRVPSTPRESTARQASGTGAVKPSGAARWLWPRVIGLDALEGVHRRERRGAAPGSGAGLKRSSVELHFHLPQRGAAMRAKRIEGADLGEVRSPSSVTARAA